MNDKTAIYAWQAKNMAFLRCFVVVVCRVVFVWINWNMYSCSSSFSYQFIYPNRQANCQYNLRNGTTTALLNIGNLILMLLFLCLFVRPNGALDAHLCSHRNKNHRFLSSCNQPATWCWSALFCQICILFPQSYKLQRQFDPVNKLQFVSWSPPGRFTRYFARRRRWVLMHFGFYEPCLRCIRPPILYRVIKADQIIFNLFFKAFPISIIIALYYFACIALLESRLPDNCSLEEEYLLIVPRNCHEQLWLRG